MPIVKEWNPGAYSVAAIWKIEEPESFFKEQTGLESAIRHDKRRTEYLAGRYLLRHLEEEFPIHAIKKDEHDKPRTEQDEFYFSIAHSWPYVAVMIDPRNEVGIDIQTWRPEIGQVKDKFLSEEEQQLLENDPKLLTIAWCAKEAAYKWYGKKGVYLKKHLPIDSFNKNTENKYIVIYFTLTKIPKMIFIESIITTDFTCSYVTNAQDWAIY